MNYSLKIIAILSRRYMQLPPLHKSTSIFPINYQNQGQTQSKLVRRTWFASNRASSILNLKCPDSDLLHIEVKARPAFSLGYPYLCPLSPPTQPPQRSAITAPSFTTAAYLRTRDPGAYTYAIAFIAHTKIPWNSPFEPTHTNHWTIFLRTSDNAGVHVNYDDSLEVHQLNWMPSVDTERNCERVVWVPMSSRRKTRELLEIVESCMRKDSMEKVESRDFVLRVLGALIKSGVLDVGADEEAVECVSRDVRTLWPDNIPLPLRSELEAPAQEDKGMLQEIQRQTHDRILLVGHSVMDMKGERGSKTYMRETVTIMMNSRRASTA